MALCVLCFIHLSQITNNEKKKVVTLSKKRCLQEKENIMLLYIPSGTQSRAVVSSNFSKQHKHKGHRQKEQCTEELPTKQKQRDTLIFQFSEKELPMKRVKTTCCQLKYLLHHLKNLPFVGKNK